jgi:hypothetical protein
MCEAGPTRQGLNGRGSGSTKSPNLWNGLYHPMNFPKPIKLHSKVIWKIYWITKIIKWKFNCVGLSKWVYLHNKHIIWYALVHFYMYEEKYRCKDTTKNVLSHSILYIHCVDLLIWSPTHLDFSILWFFDLLWFFKTASGGKLTDFEKFRGDIYRFIGWGLCSVRGDVNFFLKRMFGWCNWLLC